MEHKILYDSAGLFLTHDLLTTLDYRSVRQKFLDTHTYYHFFRLLWNPPSLVLCTLTRSILSWDVETITECVNSTDRLFIVHEAGMTRTASVGESY